MAASFGGAWGMVDRRRALWAAFMLVGASVAGCRTTSPDGGAAARAGAAPGVRGAAPPPAAVGDGDPGAPAGRSYAVVIGIDEYDHPSLPDLDGAVRDARAVAAVFEAQGFEVVSLLNAHAHRQAIEEQLTDRLAPTLARQDRLVVYFAGHGVTKTRRSRPPLGYIVPADADPSRRREMLSMRELVEEVFDVLEADQVLFVADACYAGLALDSRAGAGELVRVVMTAGSAGEQVVDDYRGHGLYTYHFLQGVQGAADNNPPDGRITSTELHAYIRGRVEPEARARGRVQTPQSSQLGTGEFVFRPRGVVTAAAAAAEISGREVVHYAHRVWRRGALHGVTPLDPSTMAGRAVVHRFESRGGRVRTVTRLRGAGGPHPDPDGVVSWTHLYTEGGRGDLAEVVLKDRLGNVVRRLQYSEAGATRVDFKDRFGGFSRTMTRLGEGASVGGESGKDVFGEGLEYDERGFVRRRWYLSYDPMTHARRLGEEGSWGWRYARDERGRVLRQWPLDARGEDSVTTHGIALVVYDHDARGERVGVALFGPQGEPGVNEEGVHRSTFKYDDHGNPVEEAYFDRAGEPALNAVGVHRTARQHDERGNLVRESYFAVDGTPATATVGGYASVVRRYDERGRLVAATFLDGRGAPTRNDDGFATYTSAYDARGNPVERVYLGPDGAPVVAQEGFAGFTRRYDDRGFMVEVATFGVEREPVLDQDGVYLLSSRYDARGHKVEQAYFGVGREPVANRFGVHRGVARYDARGNVVEEAYFGVDGTPVVSAQGYARWTMKHDERGDEVERAYFGAAGEPVADVHGVHRETFKHDDRGHVVEVAHWDVTGAPTVHAKLGHARSNRTYDAAGELVEERLVDAAGDVVRTEETAR